MTLLVSMDSWLKRAEDLLEVVDRRAKLVANELTDEQSNSLPAVSNGKGLQGKRSKPKGKDLSDLRRELLWRNT